MKIRSVFASLLLTLGLVTQAQAADEHADAAIGGYDPVAYQTQGKAVRGSGMFTARHAGQTYLFASADHQKRFQQTPDKYVPAYGGWCAYGVSVGKKFHTDPTVFAVVNGKTYLNLNKDIQKKWDVDRAASIKKADQHWKKIRKKASDKL